MDILRTIWDTIQVIIALIFVWWVYNMVGNQRG